MKYEKEIGEGKKRRKIWTEKRESNFMIIIRKLIIISIIFILYKTI